MQFLSSGFYVMGFVYYPIRIRSVAHTTITYPNANRRSHYNGSGPLVVSKTVQPSECWDAKFANAIPAATHELST